MKKPVVLIGVGEIGGVFAKGLLKSGYPVYPIGRTTDLADAAVTIVDPQAVIISVGEKDLHSALDTIPTRWCDRLVLLQNELLPRDWQAHNIENPTVISVWFEKKPGQDIKVLVPSLVFGPYADLIHEALNAIKIDCNVLDSSDKLLFELVAKNVYILTVNIAGLVVGGTVSELWTQHQALAREIAENVMDIQFRLIGKELNRQKLVNAMVNAFNGDLDHKCMGRSAPVRLKRTIAQADEFGLDIKRLREINK